GRLSEEILTDNFPNRFSIVDCDPMADVASSPTSRSRAVEESTRRPGLAQTWFGRVEKSDTLGRYGPLFVNRMARDPGRLKVHRGIGSQYAGERSRTTFMAHLGRLRRAADCLFPVARHRLLHSAPDQVASNLSRYYEGVGTFNNEAALRERLLQRRFNVTGPATAGIFKSVKSSDKRVESWLTEVPSRLAVLMRDIQH